MRGPIAFHLVFVLGGCAALGTTSAGDRGLPSAHIGPFRALEKAEVTGVAPFVLDGSGNPYREPSVLPMDPTNPRSTRVFLYAVASVPSSATAEDVIVRTRADDARTFYGTSFDSTNGTTKPAIVLRSTLPWEGANLGGPSALQVGSQVYLYYAGAGGIGLAQSSDGLEFTKLSSPVLSIDPSVDWETTAPSAPSVAVLPDGSFDMMYAAGSSIGEATSRDGIHFARVDANPSTVELDPVLSPAPSASPGLAMADSAAETSGSGSDASTSGPFDKGQVGDPCIVAYITPAGRLDIRVLYTGFDAPASSPNRSSAIGLAARYGTVGALVRQPTPAFSLDLHESAPSYFAWTAGELVYVQANSGGTFGSATYAAIAAGFAPAETTLPPPSAYPSSP